MAIPLPPLWSADVSSHGGRAYSNMLPATMTLRNAQTYRRTMQAHPRWTNLAGSLGDDSYGKFFAEEGTQPNFIVARVMWYSKEQSLKQSHPRQARSFQQDHPPPLFLSAAYEYSSTARANPRLSNLARWLAGGSSGEPWQRKPYNP